LSSIAHAQHACACAPNHDPVFCAAFYAPYEAAAQTAFLMLCAAKDKMPGDVLALHLRLKSSASIRGKLLRKGLPETACAAGAALRDIAGLRAVLTDRQAVYRFARVLLQSSVAQLEDVHDYIAAPKRSGYQSLHLILNMPVCLDGQAYMTPVEIQLRTAGMDAWACAEHRLIYKPEGRDGPTAVSHKEGS